MCVSQPQRLSLSLSSALRIFQLASMMMMIGMCTWLAYLFSCSRLSIDYDDVVDDGG